MSEDNAIILEPRGEHRASIIWLHGLGADGNDFVPIVPELLLPENSGIRFVFPHAPMRPVTINGGMVMRAWYDIGHPDLGVYQDQSGIEASSSILIDHINSELANGIPSNKIIIAGFSQGGAIILHTGIRFDQKLAGLLALSTYLPLQQNVENEINESNRDTPILMMHGRLDPVVPISAARQSCDYLQNHNFQVEWHDFHMQHAVCPDEINLVSRWIQDRLKL